MPVSTVLPTLRYPAGPGFAMYHYRCHDNDSTNGTLSDSNATGEVLTIANADAADEWANAGVFTSQGDNGTTYTAATIPAMLDALRLDSSAVAPGDTITQVISFRALVPAAVTGSSVILCIGVNAVGKDAIFARSNAGSFSLAVRDDGLVNSTGQSLTYDATQNVVIVQRAVVAADGGDIALTRRVYVDGTPGDEASNTQSREPVSTWTSDTGDLIGTMFGAPNNAGTPLLEAGSGVQVSELRVIRVAADVYADVSTYASQLQTSPFEVPAIVAGWPSKGAEAVTP